jgi:hypothetical protein
LDATKLLSAAHQSSELVRWAIVGGVHAKLKSLCLQAMDIKEPLVFGFRTVTTGALHQLHTKSALLLMMLFVML